MDFSQLTFRFCLSAIALLPDRCSAMLRGRTLTGAFLMGDKSRWPFFTAPMLIYLRLGIGPHLKFLLGITLRCTFMVLRDSSKPKGKYLLFSIT